MLKSWNIKFYLRLLALINSNNYTMKTKFNGILTLLLAFVVQLSFAQGRTISGTVTDVDGPLPGVSIIIKGTNQGIETDFDGNYSISANTGDVLQYNFVGYADSEQVVGSSNTINVVMDIDGALEEVIVTALGYKEEEKKLTYSAQKVKTEDSNIGSDANIKTAIAGKVAGVQTAAQAGSKLGNSGKIYLRGAISVKGKEEAMYVVDGIVTNADNVDMDNVESISVLKGPNATALYGLRAASGVVIITSKSGKKGTVRVNISNATTFDQVAYTPKYQNQYGQGYGGNGDWRSWDQSTPGAPTYFSPMNGGSYLNAMFADESWGPSFDGRDYYPWYTWFPGNASTGNANPYYAKAQKYVAQKDNIKDYFDTAINLKNNISISGGSDNFRARLGYSNTDQTGISPNTKFGRNRVSGKFDANLTDRLTLGANINLTLDKIRGDFDDGYSNATTGSFNSWFGRQVDVNKLKELQNLTTPDGYYTSWNWWGPRLYSLSPLIGYGDDLKKPTFWFNPYKQTGVEDFNNKRNRTLGSINASYVLNKNFDVSLVAQYSGYNRQYKRETPYEMEYSSNAENLGYTNYVNSFSLSNSVFNEFTVRPSIDYKAALIKDDVLDLKMTLGYISRNNKFERVGNYMSRTGNPIGGELVGLAIPDYYDFSNSREKITPSITDNRYKVNSVFSKINLSFKDYLIFNADIRNDWDSRYDIVGTNNKNAFLFGSGGLNFIFSEAATMPNFINFGRVFVNYAQVGTEIRPYLLNPSGNLGNTYGGLPTQNAPSSQAALNIEPATSASLEFGGDIRMFDKRVRLNFAYYNEDRKDEILASDVSSISGINNYIAPSGLVNRKGIEFVLGLTPVKSENFKWDATINFGKNTTKVKSVGDGVDTYQLSSSAFGHAFLVNKEGEEWGQIVGNKILRDAAGTPILNASGLYQTVNAVSFGSVLPDYVGGFVNRFSYKGITLAGTLSFQKGGKFYSLTENWGTYSGLLEDTAGFNDLGNPKRADVADGGGVHVQGVDASGAPVDTYVDAHTYYQQFHNNDIAEPFVHDASYLKLSDLSLSYSLPKKVIKNFMQSATIGLVARNVALLSVSKDNTQRWDPSEMSQQYGENGQLPGTRSYGFNVKLTF